MGLFVLVGCGTSSGAVRPLEPAPTGDTASALCAEAASCRDTLKALLRVPATSACDTQKRTEVARRACALGVGEGCTQLGRVEGEASRDLFQRACEQGDGEGCARHGLSTLLGEGAPRDEAAGRAELQEACDKHPEVGCGIAVLGLTEDARRRDASPEQELLALFAQRGCDAGDGLACRFLGEAFHEGLGVSRDAGKAFELYARACEAGNGAACANEGVLSLQSGAGASTRADDLFTRGCALGSSEACRLLMVETLEHRGGMKDDATQRALFREACDRGAAVGCLALYDALRHQPAENGTRLELPGLLKRACRLGEARACEFLDDVSRVSQRQCGAGSAPACGVLGALLLSEPTVESEATEGMRFLQRACQEGDAASCALVLEVAPRSSALTCRSR
ncbi:tetratricopeptide repeat protein [Archangium sp.]|uniref:tetratricopeptide repeat protein n=1 Tax=Archangium sp. TaxID=1872627 RepID=UPI00389A4B9B